MLSSLCFGLICVLLLGQSQWSSNQTAEAKSTLRAINTRTPPSEWRVLFNLGRKEVRRGQGPEISLASRYKRPGQHIASINRITCTSAKCRFHHSPIPICSVLCFAPSYSFLVRHVPYQPSRVFLIRRANEIQYVWRMRSVNEAHR